MTKAAFYQTVREEIIASNKRVPFLVRKDVEQMPRDPARGYTRREHLRICAIFNKYILGISGVKS